MLMGQMIRGDRNQTQGQMAAELTGEMLAGPMGNLQVDVPRFEYIDLIRHEYHANVFSSIDLYDHQTNYHSNIALRAARKRW